MFIEGLRTDSLYIPGTELRISQVLAAVIFVVCLVLLVIFAIKKPQIELYHKVAVEGTEDKKESSSDNFIEKIKAIFKSKSSDDKSEEKKNEENEK